MASPKAKKPPREKAVKKLECLFCLKKVGKDRMSRECTESLFNSCFRRLPSDIIKKTSLDEFLNNNGPFCGICFNAAQQLSSKNDLFAIVEKEINDFVSSLTFSILQNRDSSLNTPFEYDSNIHIEIHHRVQICDTLTVTADDIVSTIGEEFDCFEVEVQETDSTLPGTNEIPDEVSVPVVGNADVTEEKQDNEANNVKKPILKKIILQRNAVGQKPDLVSCECGLSFENEAKLIEHGILCPKNDSYLNEAEKSEATSIRYRCGNCGFLAKSLEGLDEHKKRHFKKYSCKICGEKFIKLRLLKIHKRHHRESRHTCPTCGKKFLSQRLLYLHEIKHTDGNDEVVEEVITPSDLWKNPKTPKRPPERTCPTCGEVCRSQVHYNYHKASKHPNREPYECTICHRKFKLQKFLKNHMHQVHIAVKDYLCAEEKCGKSFISLLLLKKHTQLEHSDDNFKCELCGFKTLIQKTMENHKAHYHNPKKKFECIVCGVRVSALSSLQNHERIHTGEKPHECSLCDERFRTKSLLKIHTNQKHMPGNYKCPSCDYIAGTLTLLKTHSICHSEDKPFDCDKCGRRFKAKATMMKHQRISCKSNKTME